MIIYLRLYLYFADILIYGTGKQNKFEQIILKNSNFSSVKSNL